MLAIVATLLTYLLVVVISIQIPLFMFLVYLERKNIFGHIQPCFGVGTILLVVALALYYLARKYSPLVDQNDSLALRILSIVLVWMAGFILCPFEQLTARYPITS